MSVYSRGMIRNFQVIAGKTSDDAVHQAIS